MRSGTDATRRAVEAYARRAATYDRAHGEIFNEPEQARLRRALEVADACVASGTRRALDYGCGSGNLTKHLLDLGFHVTAADVSPQFLRLVRERYGVEILELEDGDARHVPDAGFDLIALYSVLHHIPDYLGVVRQLLEKLKPGGVLFIDHEANANYWEPNAELRAFRAELAETPNGHWWDPERKRWQYLLRAGTSPRRNYYRFKRWRDPRWSREGDIHIWHDDHIEFDRLADVIHASSATVLERFDYLLYKEGYDPAIWGRHRNSAADSAGLIARRDRRD